jgi:hypothetical protein
VAAFILPLQGRTRRYTITYVGGGRREVEAEGMWPRSTCVEFMGTVFIGDNVRHLCVQRVILTELDHVTREDGAVWAASAR